MPIVCKRLIIRPDYNTIDEAVLKHSTNHATLCMSITDNSPIDKIEKQ